MLLKQETNFKLPQKYQKVLDHCLCINNGLILSTIKESGDYCLTHFSENGKQLAELTFKDDGPESMTMTTKNTVLALFPCTPMEFEGIKSKGHILQWELKQHLETKIPFEFTFNLNFSAKILIFELNRKMCIQQIGPLGDNRLRLTYFQLPFTIESKPINLFQDEDKAWTHDYTVVTKGNTHSMVCWMKSLFTEAFEFYTYDLVNKLQHHEIINDLGVRYQEETPNVEVNTAAMWQMRKDQFCFITHSSRTKTNEEDGIINNNYVVNVKDRTLREANFKFKNIDQHELHIHQMNFGSTFVIKTIAFKQGQAIDSPVFYISNEKEEIVAIEDWKCNHLHKYHFPGYDDNLMIQGLYENGQVDYVTIQSKKIMEGKQLTLYLLMGLLPEVDSDLFHEIANLIDYA